MIAVDKPARCVARVNTPNTWVITNYWAHGKLKSLPLKIGVFGPEYADQFYLIVQIMY